MVRVFSYVGLLAVVVIIAILAVHVLKGVSTAAEPESGEAKAVRQINADGDEKIDPQSAMKDTIHDALSH